MAKFDATSLNTDLQDKVMAVIAIVALLWALGNLAQSI
jgi:hypothetical protein